MLVGHEGLVRLDPQTPYKPLTADGITPYSLSTHRIIVQNPTAAAITINSVAITPIDGGRDGEWAITAPGNVKRVPFSLDNTAVPAGMEVEFNAHFIPVESGPRRARYTITYDGAKTISFVIEGRGRDNIFLSPKIEATTERIIAHAGVDFWVGAAVGDANDNLYASGDPKQILDRFSYDLSLSSLDPTGQLRWAKQWHEDYAQYSPDPGQNAQSGGASNSIAYGAEGAVYLAANRSIFSSNNWFQAMILRVNPVNGELVWARGFSPLTNISPSGSQAQARYDAQVYSVDATLPDRIIATGAANNGMILVFALSKTDGSLIYHRLIEPHDGRNDRGHAIRVLADGSGYIAGSGDGTGLLLRLTDLHTNEPALAWSRKIPCGVGCNINDVEVSPEGDAFLSVDVRGATTRFVAARISSAGEVTWSKVWDTTNSGDKNNTYNVQLVGTKLYVGGRIAFQPLDTESGDGFFLSLNAADGAYDWAATYYSGKGPENKIAHVVKAIVPRSDGKLWVMQDAYTGPLNFEKFWGMWYRANDNTLELPGGDGAMRLETFQLTTTDITAQTTMTTYTPSSGVAATAHVLDGSSRWRDLPPTLIVAPAKEFTMGDGGQNHLLIQVVQMK